MDQRNSRILEIVKEFMYLFIVFMTKGHKRKGFI